MCECGIDKDNENFREDSEKHKFYEFKIVFLILRENRSSRSDMIFKWSDLKNIVKFTGKHLRRSHFFNTVARWRPATLLRRDYGTGVSCEFCDTFKNTYFAGDQRTATSENNTLGQLLNATIQNKQQRH